MILCHAKVSFYAITHCLMDTCHPEFFLKKGISQHDRKKILPVNYKMFI
jgi:hypothetical protein